MYRPTDGFTTVMQLFNPIYDKIKGTPKKTYEYVDEISCSFKTFGGTEQIVNGVLMVIETANIETWYRPDIKASSIVKLGDKTYEVIGEPENINMRNQFLKFKVKRIKGDS